MVTNKMMNSSSSNTSSAGGPAEAKCDPTILGREFVRQYYTMLNEAPQNLHR